MKRKTNISVQDNRGIRVRPNLIVGDPGSYSSADILDANATEKIITDAIDGGSGIIYKIVDDVDNLKENVAEIYGTTEQIEEAVTALQGDVAGKLSIAIPKNENIENAIDNVFYTNGKVGRPDHENNEYFNGLVWRNTKNGIVHATQFAISDEHPENIYTRLVTYPTGDPDNKTFGDWNKIGGGESSGGGFDPNARVVHNQEEFNAAINDQTVTTIFIYNTSRDTLLFWDQDRIQRSITFIGVYSNEPVSDYYNCCKPHLVFDTDLDKLPANGVKLTFKNLFFDSSDVYGRVCATYLLFEDCYFCQCNISNTDVVEFYNCHINDMFSISENTKYRIVNSTISFGWGNYPVFEGENCGTYNNTFINASRRTDIPADLAKYNRVVE